ncbi:MAG: methylmalonyl-CoA mutase family protein, partial [Vicinamibacterales bacterium]|nr:methylmalonyl-CoA mutase family protein [Vicinamibacterales bacterium]
GQRLSFFFNAHNNFLEEVAKFRAARRMWARIMRDRFGATNVKAQQLRFHTQTAGSTLTAQQSDNNVVRVTMQALAAVLGGTQSLHCNGRDEALALPTEASATLALRTQQVILHESGVADIVDPLGGSYAIEALTNDIEAQATALLRQIDDQGGTLTAIENGVIQRMIQDSAYSAQQAIDNGEAIVVGVNKYATEEKIKPEVFRVDPIIEREQADRVRAVRAGRSESDTQAALAAVDAAARGGSNLVPPIIAAVDKHATLGEVADTMRRAFGEHRES